MAAVGNDYNVDDIRLKMHGGLGDEACFRGVYSF